MSMKLYPLLIVMFAFLGGCSDSSSSSGGGEDVIISNGQFTIFKDGRLECHDPDRKASGMRTDGHQWQVCTYYCVNWQDKEDIYLVLEFETNAAGRWGHEGTFIEEPGAC